MESKGLKFRVSWRIMEDGRGELETVSVQFRTFAAARRHYKLKVLAFYRQSPGFIWEICLNRSGVEPWVSPIYYEGGKK